MAGPCWLESFLSSEAWEHGWVLATPWELLWKPMTGPVSAGGDITTHRAAVGCQGPCGSTLLGENCGPPCAVSWREGASGWGRPALTRWYQGVSCFSWWGAGVLWPQLDCVSLDDGTQGSSLIDRPPQPRAPGGH